MEADQLEKPPVDQPKDDHPKKTHEKRERKQFKSEYVFDPDTINIDSEIPPLPKKSELLKKPDLQQLIQKQKKIKEKIAKLSEQKEQIRVENFILQRTNQKGQQQNKYDIFKNQIEQVKELKQKLAEVKKERNEMREKLTKLIDEAKSINTEIKELGEKQKGSKQNLSSKIQQLQSKLTTAVLSKDEEKNLNNQITLLKRKIKDAESIVDAEIRIGKAKERKDELNHEIEELKAEKEPFELKFKQIQELLEQKNAFITNLKKDLDTGKQQILQEKEKNNQEWEKWKENKKIRVKQVQEKIKKLNEQIQKLWENFNQQKEAYWKQKHYVDWVQWQIKVKSRKANGVEREKKKIEYQKREKEFEKKEKLQKYIGEIELCNQLIDYLKSIKEDFNKSLNISSEKNKKQPVDINAKLAVDSQWKKEKVQIIVSKKSQLQEEPPAKKGKKHKNNEKKDEQKPFNIPFNVQNQFESLKIFSPSSIQEIDKKIEELKEREKFFERACQQGQLSEADVKFLEEMKTKKAVPKEQKKKQTEEEFPTI